MTLDLLCGPDDTLWVGTNQGLLQWIPGRSRFEPVPGGPSTAIHALARGDAQGGDEDQDEGGPQRNALAKSGDEPPDDGDHGVRPVR